MRTLFATTTATSTASPLAGSPPECPRDNPRGLAVEETVARLRGLIREREGYRAAPQERWECPGLVEGLPQGLIVNVYGLKQTSFVCGFLSKNKTLKVCWVENETTIYPPALAQRGVALEQLLFIVSPQVAWAVGEALRSQLFDVVVCEGLREVSERMTSAEERMLRRFQIQCGQAKTTLLLMTEERVPAWPIGLSVSGVKA